jgi:hypothetical protein
MINSLERREFDRFRIKFPLEVSAKDTSRKQFNEKTISKNISGGGARFITRKVDKYYPGQELKMIFYLPRTGNLEALMKAKAKVIRIDQLSESVTNQKNVEKSIAVQFETLLNFERVT